MELSNMGQESYTDSDGIWGEVKNMAQYRVFYYIIDSNRNKRLSYGETYGTRDLYRDGVNYGSTQYH